MATAIAVDRSPRQGELLLTATFSIPARAGVVGGAGRPGGGGGDGVVFTRTNAGPQGPAAWVVGLSAPTLAEAEERFSRLSSREPFWAHVRIVVLGEPFARQGIGELLDALVRHREARPTPWLAVARGIPGYRLVELPAPFGPSAEHLARMMEILERSSATVLPQRLHHFLLSYSQPGIDPVAPGLTFEMPVPPDRELTPSPGTDWPALARAGETAVFRGDRLAGWLSAVETRALLMLRGMARPFTLSIPCPKGQGRVAVNVVRFRTLRTARWPGPGTREARGRPGAGAPPLPRFAVRVSTEGALGEKSCEPPLGPDGLEEVEQALAGSLRTEMERLVTRLHGELRADPVGFGLEIFRTRPALWKQLAPRWRDLLARLPVDIEVSFRIRRGGLTVGQLMGR